MKAIKLKKDGTPDLRSFPKDVRNVVKQLMAEKKQRELAAIKNMLITQDILTSQDIEKMSIAGTQSIFHEKRIVAAQTPVSIQAPTPLSIQIPTPANDDGFKNFN